MIDQQDEKYFRIIATALQVCANYKPKFGKTEGAGLTLEQFQQMYGSDPFYSWVGMDAPLVYAAHKAAGGITSIYRQLGNGCERLFRAILQDYLGLSEAEATWSYQVPQDKGTLRTLSLDGRIDIQHLRVQNDQERVELWMREVKSLLALAPDSGDRMKGVVFEVRQGYKSKDSKRQNADIANAANAYAHSYIPVMASLSTQIDAGLIIRYRQARWLLLTGTTVGTATTSTYGFAREVLGYDLASFFQRNTLRIKAEMEVVLKALLSA